MRGWAKQNRWAGTVLQWMLAPVWLVGMMPMLPQQAAAPAMRLTTQERLETEAWWPTMERTSLQSYAGSEACVRCHAEQATGAETGMQQAARRGTDAGLKLPGGQAAFAAGHVRYGLMAGSDGLLLTAASGGRKVAQAADWSFGAGELAHTFLYKARGQWMQSEVSYYTKPAALDITTGFGASASSDPAAALGNALSPAEARTCFGCHTVHATSTAGFEPLHAEAGIGCEACHGPGRAHAGTGGKQPGSGEIFQPAKLSPADSIDFCGACHRSFADASLSTGPQADRAVVRFQPYRLEESKCWRLTQDERLTCVACHDPHKPLNRDVASYDRNCLQCHSGNVAGAAHAGVVCPRATKDCVSCHMPKVELPSMHGSFTDHFIRVAKAGEPLPR